MLNSGMAKRNPTPAPTPPKVVYEVVDPRWLLKAGGIAFAVALLCAYGTLCWLFYQGQWQFALHPSRAVAKTPASLGLQFQPIRFAVDATGQPQLSGWFIPSDTPSALTALMLHSGDGDISNALPTAQLLHTARLNVFLFDYRGFGASLGDHPTEALMQVDAEYALNYLTTTRGLAPSQIIPFGQGIGASLATRLCAQHHDLPALILDSPTGDIEASIAHDARSKFIFTSLFLREHFALTGPLSKLTTPKLIISHTGDIIPLNIRTAADPKVTVELRLHDDVLYVQTLTRFLDLYAPSQIPTLAP
jgi:pimeloyl-ACP methyl ester carboxylesterase